MNLHRFVHRQGLHWHHVRHMGGMGNMCVKVTMGGMNDMAGQTEREQCVDGHAKPQKVFSAH